MSNQAMRMAQPGSATLRGHTERAVAKLQFDCLQAASPTPVLFIVDGDASVRESLESMALLAGWRAESFASAESFLSHPRLTAPSCLVLCVTLPSLSGLDLQARIASDRPDMPIIFITSHNDVPTTVLAMKAGAVEFLTKPFVDDVMLKAIRCAIELSREVLEQEADLGELRERYALLSRREREVMALVVSGLMNKQAGGMLGISEITVKAHRGRVMEKMSARSFAALINMDARLCGARFQRAQTSADRLQGIGETLVQ